MWADLLAFTTKETPQKTSARRPSMKAVRPVIASNEVLHLQMRSVGSHSTSGIEKEGKKERKKERRKERTGSTYLHSLPAE